jgi:hypothetical protein
VPLERKILCLAVALAFAPIGARFIQSHVLNAAIKQTANDPITKRMKKIGDLPSRLARKLPDRSNKEEHNRSLEEEARFRVFDAQHMWQGHVTMIGVSNGRHRVSPVLSNLGVNKSTKIRGMVARPLAESARLCSSDLANKVRDGSRSHR